MAIDPGKMRDRVRLERRGEYDFETGETPWILVATVWAEYRGQSGREFREGVTAIGEERASFLCNYREGIQQVDRLVHLGRGGNFPWDIVSVQPFNFKDGIMILARKTDNVGPVE